MNQKVFSLICFQLLILFCSCSKTVYQNAWQSNKVIADGNPNEWEIPLKWYDEKSKLQYTISNDSLNLYICIRATEDESQVKIIRSGMQFQIETNAKEKQHTAIYFPLANTEMKRPASDSARTGKRPFRIPDSKSIRSRFEKEPREMELSGFKKPIGGITPLENKYGIDVDIDWDSIGIMNYEAIIPFSTFYKTRLSHADASKTFEVNIIVPAVSNQPNSGENAGEGRRRGGGGMGGGRFGGGGRKGGFRRNQSGESNSNGPSMMHETTKIKLNIKLALRPNIAS